MSEPKTIPVFDVSRIRLENIVVIQASIDNPKGVESISSDDSLDLSFNMYPAFNIEAKKIRVILSFEISSSHHEELKGSFEIAFYFSVDDFDVLITKIDEENILQIDEDLLATIGNITYSTSRGIIYQRSLGTAFANKVILPIVPTTTVMELLKGGPPDK